MRVITAISGSDENVVVYEVDGEKRVVSEPNIRSLNELVREIEERYGGGKKRNGGEKGSVEKKSVVTEEEVVDAPEAEESFSAAVKKGRK